MVVRCRGVLFSGNANNGANAGFVCANTHDTPTNANANIGSQLCLQVFPVDARGIDFLGFVFYHDHTLLRKSIKQNLCRRVAKLNKRKKQPTKAAYKQAICSWWGWCKYSDSIHLFDKLSKSFPYEIKFNRTKRAL